MTLGNLKIEGITCLAIKNINIFESMHSHGSCNLTLIPDEKKTSVKEILNWHNKKITIRADKDIIFGGIITQCRLESDSNGKILHVIAQSLSILTDIEGKKFTLQSPKKKISDILKEIEKNFKPAELAVVTDKSIAQLIYCDNLTAWEFLKNLAEMNGQVLFVDSKTDKLRINLGFKAFKEVTEKNLNFLRQSVSIDFYKRLEQNTYSGARSCYFFDTKLSTDNLKIGVGHGVKYDNQTQAVISSNISLKDTELVNEIILRHKEGCRASAENVIRNLEKFYYLTGAVLESKENNVKVQFDCDQKQSKDEAQTIPYESTMSNYFYTMPDEKEEVFVYADNFRNSAMGAIRKKNVSDAPDKKSFKIKNAEMHFEKEKISFNAAKDEISEGDGVKISTKKDITFDAKGDIYIQSSAGMLPDNQLIMSAPHFTGYGIYTGMMGQPATVQFNPAGSTVGKAPMQIKNSGSKKESVELSDIVKELNKISNTKEKKSDNKSSGGGAGGKITIEGKKSSLVQVKDSSIEMKSKNLNVKTRALIQVGYIPMPGGGTGSLSKFEGGNPKNRSDKIKVEHGTQDRKRIKEKITPVPDNKSLSR